MSTWLPDLQAQSGPAYRALADAISKDIGNGLLEPGERLPTYRDLAQRMELSLGTVTRAYAEAERRGLIMGLGRRGTFVRRGDVHGVEPYTKAFHSKGLVNLNVNLPAPLGEEDQLLSAALAEESKRENLSILLRGSADPGVGIHEETASAWLNARGWKSSPDEICICAGGQNGLQAALAAIAHPGDIILAESLTYPGMKAMARTLHLRLRGISMDAHGIQPEAFEEACRSHPVRVLLCNPNLHPATVATLPQDRREELIEIAERNNVLILEHHHDFLVPNQPLPLSNIAPDRVISLAGMVKVFSPGMLVSFLRVPRNLADPIAAGVRTSVWCAPPLMQSIATRWLSDGTADRLSALRRTEVEARQALATKHLAAAHTVTEPHAHHLWMDLPRGWTSEDFATHLRENGVAISPSEPFFVGRGQLPDKVRVCLGGPETRAELEKGLQILANFLGKPALQNGNGQTASNNNSAAAAAAADPKPPTRPVATNPFD